MTQEQNASAGSPGEMVHDLFREVFRLHSVLAAITDTVHEQAGLGTPQRRVMRVLDRHGPATIPHIAARLGVSRQFVRTVCNKLIADGSLEAVDNPLHKRSMLIQLSGAGAEIFSRAKEDEHRIIEQAMPEIESGEVVQAAELLSRIREKISLIRV